MYQPSRPLTAWQSVPSFVRFAVWVWAVSVIAGLVVTAIVLLFAVITGGAILGAL